MRSSLQRYFPFLLLVGIALNATGLFNDILEPDGTLYATIAKHMALSNDWVNLIGDGHDWLDKPHFPFWITAFSYKIFGINSFAYKLPAFLFWLLGLRFTYLLTKKLYNVTVAQVAVLVYVTALHAVLANFDVRAEPYLTTLTIGSIYYIFRVYEAGKWQHLFLAAILAACAVMTKGIFALLTIGGGFAVYWMVTKQWKQFLNYRWWLLLILVFIFIIPELYCLYMQFDMHPEKIVFNQQGVSGIRFFFWDSQFGRFFNTGPITGNGDISFFLHTTLWAFLPWSVIFYIAVFRLISKKSIITNKAQWIIFGSTALTFLLFSFSKFQLPHYIIILFPQFAMIASDYLVTVFDKASTGLSQRTVKAISVLQTVILILVAVLVIFLTYYAAVPAPYIITILTLIVTGLTLLKNRKHSFINVMNKSFASMIVLFLFLNLFFYPYIQQYQSGMVAARWLKDNQYKEPFGMYKEFMHSFEFYADGEPAWLYTTADVKKFAAAHKDTCIVYTTSNDIDSLRNDGLNVSVLKDFEYFRVSMLTGSFLNPLTRPSTLRKVSLVKVSL